MRPLSDTIERLARLKRQQTDEPATSSGLVPLDGFGSNPGDLTGFLAVPSLMSKRPALVVVLHGCQQTAAGYDVSSGWSKLAEEQGFLVLYPQQARSNNPNLCFNWFSRDDASRDRGETLSIRQMIAHIVETHGVAEDKIFITGLSAGGAMANVMLASYPELFAGGAIIAGLPFGTAHSIPEAFDRMRGHRLPDEGELQASLRSASPHQGPWPRVSIWHGTNDTTVHEANSRASLAQWRGVLGASEQPDRLERHGAHERHVWTGTDGREVMEFYALAEMGHGTPLDTEQGYEQAGAFMLEAGLSATLGIATFWGLLGKDKAYPISTGSERPKAERMHARTADAGQARTHEGSGTQKDDGSIQAVIERALRTAGLMR
jgi:poly(hydroxyalkanoate) depolymerase family esterase